MQAETRVQFDRDMACSEADLLRWLPGAGRGRPVQVEGGCARIDLSDQAEAGCLTLRWTPLPPRRIALVCLERLKVSFAFDGLTADQRGAFMRHFDLYTQRGGG